MKELIEKAREAALQTLIGAMESGESTTEQKLKAAVAVVSRLWDNDGGMIEPVIIEGADQLLD